MTKTTGTITSLKAQTLGKYTSTGERVVGSLVTITTEWMVEDKLEKVESVIFVEPNTMLPVLGDKVTITITKDKEKS